MQDKQQFSIWQGSSTQSCLVNMVIYSFTEHLMNVDLITIYGRFNSQTPANFAIFFKNKQTKKNFPSVKEEFHVCQLPILVLGGYSMCKYLTTADVIQFVILRSWHLKVQTLVVGAKQACMSRVCATHRDRRLVLRSRKMEPWGVGLVNSTGAQIADSKNRHKVIWYPPKVLLLERLLQRGRQLGTKRMFGCLDWSSPLVDGWVCVRVCLSVNNRNVGSHNRADKTNGKEMSKQSSFAGPPC